MSSEQATDEAYDVLLIDDVCSFLTPRLVEQVRLRGRLVVGVFDGGDGADAKRRLLDCGVDDVVEADASPDEILQVVAAARRLVPVSVEPPSEGSRAARGEVVVVGAPPGGSGASEISLELAELLGAGLVDADDLAPSLAQRRGVDLHPNLRTAIDLVHHRSGDIGEAFTHVGNVALLAGLAAGEDWAQVHAGEVEAVIDEIAGVSRHVVVNIGSGLERAEFGEGRFGLGRRLVASADVIVAVGLPTPVGVTRLARWVEEAATLNETARVRIVVNRVRRSGFERSEVASELERLFPGAGIDFVPDDQRVIEAAWAGTRVARGPFRRALARMAQEIPR
jgi:MinD-like ATPase involved in chromosome partitioning or flagellar assembly